MNSTDLIVDGIRDHIEAEASSPLDECTFVIRDQATDRGFPQVRVSERSIEEHDVLLGVYTAQVEVSLRTNPEDTDDDAHRTMVEQIWCLVADENIEHDLSSVDSLFVQDVRCAGPMTEVEDNYRLTTFDLRCVFHS